MFLGASKVGNRMDRGLGRLLLTPQLAAQHLAFTHSGACALSEARAQVWFPVTVLGRQGEEPLSRCLWARGSSTKLGEECGPLRVRVRGLFESHGLTLVDL